MTIERVSECFAPRLCRPRPAAARVFGKSVESSEHHKQLMFIMKNSLSYAVVFCTCIPPLIQGATNSAASGTQVAAEKGQELRWQDVTAWGVEGRAWPDSERARWFDRLPAAAEKTVTREVWDRSRP